MKNLELILLLFLLICCINKNEDKIKNQKINKKFMTYDEFNKKYFYWNGSNSLLQNENKKLKKYLLDKEKKLENFINLDGSQVEMEKVLRDLDSEEEKLLQMIKFIIEAKKEENNTMKFSNIFFIGTFSDEIRENRSRLLNKFHEMKDEDKYLLSLLEKNFSKEEIRLFFDVYYINGEFGNYEIEGRYGLKKVDNIISEVEKIQGISDQERMEREKRSNETLFKNEYYELDDLHILEDNRIIIVDKNEKPIKEIKIKDYKNVDIVIYKSILYIYDDNKIYEYSLKNLNDVKVIDLKDTEKK